MSQGMFLAILFWMLLMLRFGLQAAIVILLRAYDKMIPKKEK